VIVKYPAPIRAIIEMAQWELAEHLYRCRLQGAPYHELAVGSGMHRTTVRRYARAAEAAARYRSADDQAPSCNELRLGCVVCGQGFVASRADARYCSNACRQDAYRHRKRMGEATP
jgi:hypothetical protein